MPTYSFYSVALTLSDDGVHRISDYSIPFYEANFHCETASVLYGTGEECSAPLNNGDVVFFRNGDLRDFFFKNAAAGVNGKVVVVCTVPTDAIKNKLTVGS